MDYGKISYNTSSLKPGVYYYKIFTNEGIVYKKGIKL